MIQVKTPWLNNYGSIPHTLTYPDGTMWAAVENVANQYPDYTAYTFMGKKNFLSDIVPTGNYLCKGSSCYWYSRGR